MRESGANQRNISLSGPEQLGWGALGSKGSVLALTCSSAGPISHQGSGRTKVIAAAPREPLSGNGDPSRGQS